MKKSIVILLATSLIVVSSSFKSQNARTCDEAMNYYIEHNYSPRTGLVYTCRPENVKKSTECTNGMFHWYKGIPGGYGAGMGDCDLIMGTALSGMVDKWYVITDKKEKELLKAQAEKLANGILNLATMHGIKGFVARGICEDDAKSICSISSIDQYTHWEHSLWKYSKSGMASEAFLERYRTVATQIAEFMEEKVTEENGYNFGLADGTIPDPRGICTLWGPDKKPHAAARLPMIYLCTFIATGDAHWKGMYEKYADASLQMTIRLKELTEAQTLPYMPCYSLYQAMCSLEVMYCYEQNSERKALILECMSEFSKRAKNRALNADPQNPPYGMCWDGELLLSELMDPNFKPGPEERIFLDQSISRIEPEKMGWCRAAHIYSAFWRSERNAITPGNSHFKKR